MEAGEHRTGNDPAPMAIMSTGPMADVHRIAAADPVPEAEHVGRVDTKLRSLPFDVGGDRGEMLRHCRVGSTSLCRRSHDAGRVAALVIVSSVVKVFDDTMKSVSAASRPLRRLDQNPSPSTLADEAEGQVELVTRTAARPRYAISGPEIGAADADIHHVSDTFSGVAQ